MANILCIDAGFRATGWAVLGLPSETLLAAGTITTQRANKKRGVRVADDDAEACQQIARALLIVSRRRFSVRGIVCELPHGGSKSGRASSCMARAGAVVAALAEFLEVPAEWVTPDDVKRVTGLKGAVSKADVAAAVREHWLTADMVEHEPDLTEHEVDALAAYLAARDGQLVRTLKGMR